jgi:hypothetical protein
MNTKPPFQTPSFVGTSTSPTSPTLCFPSSKHHKHENTGLCGCRRAPKSKCISAIGEWLDIFLLMLCFYCINTIFF